MFLNAKASAQEILHTRRQGQIIKYSNNLTNCKFTVIRMVLIKNFCLKLIKN